MGLRVKELFTIDEPKKTLKVSATLRLKWEDERLALKSYPECWSGKCPETFMQSREVTTMENKVMYATFSYQKFRLSSL